MSSAARAGGALRWTAAFAVVLGAHAAGAAYVLGHLRFADDLPAGAPVMTVALAPLAAAPPAQDLPPAPAPTPEQTETPPEPKAEQAPPPAPAPVTAEPAPAADLPLPQTREPAKQAAQDPAVLPPPRPRDIARHDRRIRAERHASAAAAPQAERRAARASAPAEGRRTQDPDAVPSWKSRLVAQIERHKHYPAEAEARALAGVAEVAFSVDRHGGVHHARIVRSTGVALLDRDALAWIARASPLPPPPPELGSAPVPIVVPLRYNFR